jgi:hypothetical protein
MYHLGLPPPAWFPCSESPWPVLRKEHEPCAQPPSGAWVGPDGRTPSARAILSRASIVKDLIGSPFGLPGISLAEPLAQFQHDLARRNEEGRRDYLKTPSPGGAGFTHMLAKSTDRAAVAGRSRGRKPTESSTPTRCKAAQRRRWGHGTSPLRGFPNVGDLRSVGSRPRLRPATAARSVAESTLKPPSQNKSHET